MKIEYTNGCTTDRIEVDGEDIHDLSALKLGQLKYKVVGFLDKTFLEEQDLQDLIIWITDRFGTTENLGICETCGDTTYKTTLIV